MEILSLVIGLISKMWQVADCRLKLYCDVAAKEANSDWGEHCKAVYPIPSPGGSPGRYSVWEYQKPLRYHSVPGGIHFVSHQRSNRGPISKILLPYLCLEPNWKGSKWINFFQGVCICSSNTNPSLYKEYSALYLSLVGDLWVLRLHITAVPIRLCRRLWWWTVCFYGRRCK